MMIRRSNPTPFNSSLETGIRSLAILAAAHPAAFDLERLLTIHDGKEKKDRTVPIPDSLKDELKERLKYVSKQNDKRSQGNEGVISYVYPCQSPVVKLTSGLRLLPAMPPR